MVGSVPLLVVVEVEVDQAPQVLGSALVGTALLEVVLVAHSDQVSAGSVVVESAGVLVVVVVVEDDHSDQVTGSVEVDSLGVLVVVVVVVEEEVVVQVPHAASSAVVRGEATTAPTRAAAAM